MSKCPHCNTDIHYLDYHKTKTCDSKVELVDGRLIYSSETISTDDLGYGCPICYEDICENEQEAVEFLKGDEHEGTKDCKSSL